ncbi:hypothetical protein TNCV_3990831 [Trichonephila clavipes]|uniref:Uncharacterized protein n=1 Tax=Trichonephila clavipes TaxID=2585209 RepID=A0A8X6VSL3_TRICX|nr:hypothetical protein TNCV_3990831 [Trichonephila clavipes]
MGALMACTGISTGGLINLDIIRNGILTALKYTNRPYVKPHAAAIDDFFLLMQANARNHTTCLEWPACSPDLNIIQHAWDSFGRHRLLFRLGRCNSLTSGTVFPKVSPIASSHT